MKLLMEAFARAEEDRVTASDEAGLGGAARARRLRGAGLGAQFEDYASRRIWIWRDFIWSGNARARVSGACGEMSVRCGIGYDLHRLAEGRKLMIGGIEVPFDKGPVGHSDGDVLAHALCDALLGAAGLGDIGKHFPDTDPRWKGAESMQFLSSMRGDCWTSAGFAIESGGCGGDSGEAEAGAAFSEDARGAGRALGVSRGSDSFESEDE